MFPMLLLILVVLIFIKPIMSGVTAYNKVKSRIFNKDEGKNSQNDENEKEYRNSEIIQMIQKDGVWEIMK